MMQRSGVLLLLSACVALCLSQRSIASDKLLIEREKVFARDGVVHKESVRLWPVNRGTGVIFEQTVTPDIAGDSMRLHFVVQASSPKKPWMLKVIDSKSNEWSLKSGAASNDFWTGILLGAPATIQVLSDSPQNPVKLLIDRIAISTPPIKPQSIVGPDDRKPILTQTPQIRGWGGSVARIRFIGDDDVQYLCTGFLVAPRLLLTNQHCLSTATEMRSALIDFNYDSDDAKVTTLRCMELLAVNETLDYSIVRLSTDPGIAVLKLTDSDVSESQALLVIEHPGGETKQVSIIDCRVNHASMAGAGAMETDFGHDCDTLGGSSGSPVQDFSSGKVFGLHHLGIPEGTNILMNRAVKIKLILANLATQSPATMAEIQAAQK